MLIIKAERNDLQEILDLQYLAYQSEAILLDNFSIPPLKQTLNEVEQEFENGMILKVVDDNDIIIGSVRAYNKNGTLYIGKLIVHPYFQGQGIGTKLLIEIEKECPQGRYELFTSDKSTKNLRLYERLGYVKYKEQEVAPGLKFIYLQKQHMCNLESIYTSLTKAPQTDEEAEALAKENTRANQVTKIERETLI